MPLLAKLSTSPTRHVASRRRRREGIEVRRNRVRLLEDRRGYSLDVANCVSIHNYPTFLVFEEVPESGTPGVHWRGFNLEVTT